MKSHLTLEEAVGQIDQWRESKQGKRGRIPLYCWRHAIRLSKEHTSKTVANKMRLKLSDLESKIVNFNRPLNHTKKLTKQKGISRKVSKHSSSLIELPHLPVGNEGGLEKKIGLGEKCILELDLRNGMKLRIFE